MTREKVMRKDVVGKIDGAQGYFESGIIVCKVERVGREGKLR
jgi:hypothetical protein